MLPYFHTAIFSFENPFKGFKEHDFKNCMLTFKCVSSFKLLSVL